MLIRMLSGLLLVTLVGGCGASAVPPDVGGGEAGRAGGREAGVYAAVLRHYLTGTDHGMGKGYRWSTVYVLDRAVKQAADPDRSVDNDGGAAIGPSVRRRVTKELADVAPVRFVSDRRSVVTGKQGCEMTKQNAVLISLAPVPETGKRLEIGINGWQTCKAGTWLTYVIVAAGDGWRVDGTTGPVGIS